ncbi:MAG TPA: hypothetical protein VLE97_11290 [Gaiellaceae bacterium]|nr:hypothetical protein [Gaiellaceae bacterium]
MSDARRFSDRFSDKKSDKKSGKKSDKKVDEKKVDEKRPRATTMAASQILPNLFVGTREDAEALGDRVPDDWACISVTEYRSRYKREEQLPYEPVGSLDMPFMSDAPGGWHADPHKLDLIAEVIWWKIQAGKKVLVHCIHAQERAPLTAAWYLAWSGPMPLAQAYATIQSLHPRTERRDKWLRGTPGRRRPELAALLDAARGLSSADPQTRAAALASLETAAIAWAAAKYKT